LIGPESQTITQWARVRIWCKPE